MHGLDPSRAIHFFTDASAYAAGLLVSQYEGKTMYPILYDAFTFTAAERNYGTYKRELAAIVRFASKYEYMLQNPEHPGVVYTDHKPLLSFLNSDYHDGIYARWANKLRRVNIVLEYIEGPRNKVADGLSRTIFDKLDAEKMESFKQEVQAHRNDPKWFWKDGKGGYEEFLDSLLPEFKAEAITEGIMGGISIHLCTASSAARNKFESSGWYRDVFRVCSNLSLEIPGVSMDTIKAIRSKALNYSVRGDELFRKYKGMWIPCAVEGEVLGILRRLHDEGGHYGKTMIVTKLRGKVYWPNQATDVQEYIEGCHQCARYGSAIKALSLQSVKVRWPFQLMDIDFIGPLSPTPHGNKYILNIVDYFSRFIIAFALPDPGTAGVIASFNEMICRYYTPEAVYFDRGTHFTSIEFGDFLTSKGIKATSSPSGSSKSTGMIERSNYLLEMVMGRTLGVLPEWDTHLSKYTKAVNHRFIQHLDHTPAEILLGVSENQLPEYPRDGHQGLMTALAEGSYVEDPQEERDLVESFLAWRIVMRKEVKEASEARKDREKDRYDRGTRRLLFSVGDLVMLHQK